MTGDAISSAGETTPYQSGPTFPSSTLDSKVKRKPMGPQRFRPSIQTAPSRYSNAPKLSNSQHPAYETPTRSPYMGYQTPMDGYGPHAASISSLHEVALGPESHVIVGEPRPQDIPTGFAHSDGIGDGSGQAVSASSATTIASVPPVIPQRLRPSVLPPSPRSVLKEQSKPMSTMREGALVLIVCMAHFLTQAGLSQSIAPLPFLEASFTTPSHRPSPPWYSAAYSLTFGTFILPSGRLGDIYGSKRIFVIGWLWFAVFSIGAGLYPRMQGNDDRQANGEGAEIFFCFCRALQGIGPALLIPNGLAILGRTYPDGNRKNMAFALFGSCAPLGFVGGSAMSSLLAQKTDWTWGYRALAIACAVMAVVSVPIIPHLPGSDASADVGKPLDSGIRQAPFWKTLDIPGTVLGVTGLILINVALNQAPLVGWTTPYTYFLLILGITILSFFFFIEFSPSITSHPLIPLGILSFDTCFVLACIACGWGAFGIWIFYSWEFLERLRGLSPLLASAQFTPAALSGLVAALSTGFLLSKISPQVIMVLSMCAFLVGTLLFATAPVNQIYWTQVFFSVLIMPWGMDMSFPSGTILLSSKVGPENQGVAMSLVNTVVNYSISIGLGLAGTVQTLVDKDGTRLLDGYRSAWYFGIGLSATGIMLSLIFVVLSARKANHAHNIQKERVIGDAESRTLLG